MAAACAQLSSLGLRVSMPESTTTAENGTGVAQCSAMNTVDLEDAWTH